MLRTYLLSYKRRRMFLAIDLKAYSRDVQTNRRVQEAGCLLMAENQAEKWYRVLCPSMWLRFATHIRRVAHVRRKARLSIQLQMIFDRDQLKSYFGLLSRDYFASEFRIVLNTDHT